MNIIVCIKQVPDTKEIKLDPKTNTLKREGAPSIINPFDMHAIEEGLRIKDKMGGKVTAITMGPPQAEDALREAISYGVDEAILLSDRAFAGADTLATTYVLGLCIQKLSPFDLVICGKQAIDGDTAQVGPGLAERLNIPHVTWVKKIESIEDKTITIERMMDDGYDILSLRLPALITVVREINDPRVPSIRGKKRARTIEIPVWGIKELDADPSLTGLKGSPTQVKEVFVPRLKREKVLLEGTLDEKLMTLIDRLKEANIIK